MKIFNKITELIALFILAIAGLIACNKFISDAISKEIDKSYYQELKCPENTTGWTKCKVIHRNTTPKPPKKNYFYRHYDGKNHIHNRL